MPPHGLSITTAETKQYCTITGAVIEPGDPFVAVSTTNGRFLVAMAGVEEFDRLLHQIEQGTLGAPRSERGYSMRCPVCKEDTSTTVQFRGLFSRICLHEDCVPTLRAQLDSVFDRSDELLAEVV